MRFWFTTLQMPTLTRSTSNLERTTGPKLIARWSYRSCQGNADAHCRTHYSASRWRWKWVPLPALTVKHLDCGCLFRASLSSTMRKISTTAHRIFEVWWVLFHGCLDDDGKVFQMFSTAGVLRPWARKDGSVCAVTAIYVIYLQTTIFLLERGMLGPISQEGPKLELWWPHLMPAQPRPYSGTLAICSMGTRPSATHFTSLVSVICMV